MESSECSYCGSTQKDAFIKCNLCTCCVCGSWVGNGIQFENATMCYECYHKEVGGFPIVPEEMTVFDIGVKKPIFVVVRADNSIIQLHVELKAIRGGILIFKCVFKYYDGKAWEYDSRTEFVLQYENYDTFIFTNVPSKFQHKKFFKLIMLPQDAKRLIMLH